LRHLAVNVLGFASTIATRDLKVKVRRCVKRLTDLQVVKPFAKESLFSTTKRGEYVMVLERGGYFTKRRTADTRPTVPDTAIHDLLRGLGFDDRGICRLLRRFPMPMVREWTDITQSARELFGAGFFKKSPQAFLVDNLKNAVRGYKTPPDWWHEVRRAEARTQAKSHAPNAEMALNAAPDLSNEARQAYERIAKDMFAVFRAGGQPESAAKENAEKFAREYSQRGMPDLGLPFFHLLKADSF
jgi:hypothetical protein